MRVYTPIDETSARVDENYPGLDRGDRSNAIAGNAGLRETAKRGKDGHRGMTRASAFTDKMGLDLISVNASSFLERERTFPEASLTLA
jgi:hypothetical protein